MNHSKRRISRTAWVLLVIFGIPLLCCSGCLTWWIGRNRTATAELTAKIDQRKLDGLPYDDESLDAYYRQHTSDRLSDRWLAVLDIVGASDFADANVPILGSADRIPPLEEPWPEQSIAEDFLGKHTDLLQEITELGRESESVRFPIQFDSFNTLLEQAQGMRGAARLLKLQRLVAQRHGDSEAQFEAINSMIGCSHVLRRDPILVSQLVSIATHGMALSEIQDAVERNTFNADQLAALAKRLEAFEDFRTPYDLAMQGEIGFALPMIQDPTRLQEDNSGPPIPAWLGRSRDAVTYVEWMEKAVNQKEGSLQEFAAQTKQWEQDFEDEMENASLLKKYDSMTTMLVTPAVGAAGLAFVRQTMNNRLALLAIAIRRFHDEHGSYPASLSDLENDYVDSSVLLTSSGVPFGYKSTDTKIHLWGFKVQGMESDPSTAVVPNEPPDKEQSTEFDENAWWIWELQP